MKRQTRLLALLGAVAWMLFSTPSQAEQPLFESFDLPRTHSLWKWHATKASQYIGGRAQRGLINEPFDLNEYDFTKVNNQLPPGVPSLEYLPTAYLRDIPDTTLAGLPPPTSEFGLAISGEAVTYQHLAALKRFPLLRRLVVGSLGEFSEGELRAVAELSDITHLTLNCSVEVNSPLRKAGIADQALKHLGKLEQLRYLQLVFPCSDLGLKHLASLQQLECLLIKGDSRIQGETLLTDAGMRELNRLPKLKSLYLINHQLLTDAGLGELRFHKHLWNLDISGTQVNGSGFKDLVEMKQLERLSLHHSALTEPGLVEVCKLKQLRGLDVGTTAIGDEGVRLISGLHELRELNISNTKVTDSGCAYLPELTNLRRLDLFWTTITDRALPDISRLENLRDLNLSRTSVTDAGMSEIAKLKQLESLNLSSTKVTDAGLIHLAKLKNLNSLSLPREISPEAKKKLLQSLPKL